MKKEIKISGTGFHLWASLLIGLFLYLLIMPYAKQLAPRDEEQLSIGAAALFLSGMYAGRYMSGIWTQGKETIPNALYLVLIFIIIACAVWLPFHAEFPLQNRNAINIMLAGLPFLLLSIATGILIKLVRTAIARKFQQANIVAEQSRNELHLLQSQLSPHFLFNTLNNMYGISITQHEKIPPLLLKLSDLLRYSVYDVKELFVPLKNELAYLANYIDFEKLRIGDRLVLDMHVEELNDESIVIAPMLLIVFIENAFKHAKNSADEKIMVEIHLKTWGNSILFSVKNSYSKTGTDDVNTVNSNSGLGLVNVQKRLELLYSGKHDLKIENGENFYTVMLQLKVK